MRKTTEADLQIKIIQALQGAGVFFHSVPNEGSAANKIRTMQMITMGLRPGTPDLVVWWPQGIGYLEVKAPGGKVSPAQERFHARCKDHGIPCHVVWSFEDFVKVCHEKNVEIGLA